MIFSCISRFTAALSAGRSAQSMRWMVYPLTSGKVKPWAGGESGCGKSTTGRTILQLYKPTAGHVYYNGTDLTTLKRENMRKMRREMQMIFQDPYASLNPRMTVEDIIGEPLAVHGVASGKEIKEQVENLLNLVKLNPAFASRYPHEFSGGQRQRIGVARALALQPSLIICDEPISAWMYPSRRRWLICSRICSPNSI